MEIALWIAAALIALAYLVSGGMKLVVPERYRASAPWTEGVSTTVIRVVGVVELLGAIGIVLPQLTGIGAPLLTILAAGGLVLVQVVAIVIHLRRKEFNSLPVNLVLLLIPLFVLLGRLFWV
jgi:uncharacterized membrane protein